MKIFRWSAPSDSSLRAALRNSSGPSQSTCESPDPCPPGTPNGLPPAPIEELALELLGLGGEAARQPGLFVARARQLAEIAEAARQLHARYGRVPLYHAIEVEPWSRIPERRWALVQVQVS